MRHGITAGRLWQRRACQKLLKSWRKMPIPVREGYAQPYPARIPPPLPADYAATCIRDGGAYVAVESRATLSTNQIN